MSNCTLLDCQINLDRLNSAIETYNATANIKYKIKFSAGITQYQPFRHLSLDDLLKDADFMMYKHKTPSKHLLS
jgi:PleD family two-component response regulator